MLLNTTEFYNSAIIRTRREEILDQLDAVIDVGGIYDYKNNRFDHHQASFTDSYTNDIKEDVTKFSSAGLVYKHFGK